MSVTYSLPSPKFPQNSFIPASQHTTCLVRSKKAPSSAHDPTRSVAHEDYDFVPQDISLISENYTLFLFLKSMATNNLSYFPNLTIDGLCHWWLAGLCQPFLLFCDVTDQVSLNFVKNRVCSSVSPSITFRGFLCVRSFTWEILC